MEMVTLWQELDLNIEEEWKCLNDCSLYKKMQENERVYEFLAGLNRELDDVRGRILGQRPIPPTSEVFAEVRQEEARRLVMMKETAELAGEMSALNAKNNGVGPPFKMSKSIGPKSVGPGINGSGPASLKLMGLKPGLKK